MLDQIKQSYEGSVKRALQDAIDNQLTAPTNAARMAWALAEIQRLEEAIIYFQVERNEIAREHEERVSEAWDAGYSSGYGDGSDAYDG